LFLQKCESLLRRYLRRNWAKAYGKDDWPSRVRALSKREVAHNVAEWTFRNYIELAEATSADPAASAVMDAIDLELGREWRSTLEKATSPRNELAHGRIYEYKTLARFYPMIEGVDNSEAIAVLLDAARIYQRLSRMTD
jgi:hypothetical protein